MSSIFPGVSAAAEKRLKELAPGLHDHLQQFQQVGWRIEERQLGNSAGQIAHGRIALDPQIASGNKNAENASLCALAHQLGCALDRPRSSISLATRDEYVHRTLQREAAGILYELQLRENILQGTTGKRDIWSGRSEEFKALNNIRRNASTDIEAQQAIAAKLGEMRGENGKTFASILARQYDLFQISGQTGKEVIEHVQACFNETGIALPADQIIAHGYRPGEPYYWMTQEGLTAVLNEYKLGFQINGFAENEIGSAIMTAINSGTKWPRSADDKWNYYTYHDPIKNCVYGIFVKLGEKPGEIVQASMQEPVGYHEIHSPDGRYCHLDLQHAGTLIPLRADAFGSHGIPPTEIPAAIMTAMAAGRRVPEQETEEDWHAYRFRYKNLPDELTLHVRQEPNGTISDFRLVEKQNVPAAASTQSDAIDAILAGSEGNALRNYAAQLGVGEKELLGTVITGDNKKRSSLERPGFGVYRTDINGQSVTLLARMEHGRIAEVGPPSQLDLLFASFPDQEKRYAQLQKEGWRIRLGMPGGGTYCAYALKEIIIDPGTNGVASSAYGLMLDLAHEMAHAVYKDPEKEKILEMIEAIYPSKSTEAEKEDDDVKEYVGRKALNEANSLFTEYKLLDEATNDNARAGIMEALGGTPYHKEALVIYRDWKQDGDTAGADSKKSNQTDLDARIKYGKIYQGMHPSTVPDDVIYKTLWQIRSRSLNGKDARLTLMNELQSKKPPIEIQDMSGKDAPPSFDNVQMLHRLQTQSGLQEPKIIFIDKKMFVRQVKGMTPQEFENIVKNGLDYGAITVTPSPNGSNLQRATCRYTKFGAPYTIHLDFGDSGRVFNINVDISSGMAPAPLEVKPESEKRDKHQEFISWMEETLS